MTTSDDSLSTLPGPATGRASEPLPAALDQAASDIARGMFQPLVISLVSVLALGFATFKVWLYLIG